MVPIPIRHGNGPFVGNEHFPELNAELTRLAGNPLV